METAASKDNEADGLADGREEDEAGGRFSPGKPCFPLSTEGTENLYHRFDGHVIVKEPEIRYFHQFLTNCHFPNRGIANDK